MLKQENNDLRNKLVSIEENRTESSSRLLDDCVRNNMKKNIKVQRDNFDAKLSDVKQVNKLKPPKTLTTDMIEKQQEKCIEKDLKPIEEQFLMSRKEYLCLDWQTDDVKVETNTKIQQAITLEVPKWVIKDTLNCYSIEGTEDLSDEIFLKRHSKLEVNERRRKRWDIQRLRETRVIEKLRKRYMKSAFERSKDAKSLISFKTFFPRPDFTNSIEIVDKIPVMAFGEMLPMIRSKEFLLPWHEKFDISMSPTTSFTKTRFFFKA